MNACLDKVLFSLVKVSESLRSKGRRYRARVRSKKTLSVDDVCKAMAEKVHDKGQLSNFQFYVRLFEDTIRELTQQGYRVKTNLIETGLAISGTFDSADAPFDKGRTKAFSWMTRRVPASPRPRSSVIYSNSQVVNCRFDGNVPPGVYTLRVVSRSGATADFTPSTARLANVSVVG